MGSPTIGTTENPEPRRKGGANPRWTLTVATDDVDAVYCDERPSRGSWLSETPPTGVLGEMSFYYGACWLHYRSAQRQDKTQ